MSGTSKETFLARVAAALGEGRQVARRLPCDPALVERVGTDQDLLELFENRAVAVGIEVVRVTNESTGEFLIAHLQKADVSCVSLSDDPLLGDEIRGGLAAAGIEVIGDASEAWADRLYDEVGAGVTVATAGVAATGSIACVSSSQEARALSLVPPRHIALLPSDRIVADLQDLWRSRGPLALRPLPSCVTLVTGPSKTADIEGVLINGVHGPGVVTVFLIVGEEGR